MPVNLYIGVGCVGGSADCASSAGAEALRGGRIALLAFSSSAEVEVLAGEALVSFSISAGSSSLSLFWFNGVSRSYFSVAH
jgi:hypothetical protein